MIHGPPDELHPGQLWNESDSPSRSASRPAQFTISYHSGERLFTVPLSCRNSAMSRIVAPPRPARFIASRSFVMPAREMLLSIQCHHVRGRDSAGGSANPSANASAPHAIPATPRENRHTKDKRDDNSFFMFPSIAYRPSAW